MLLANGQLGLACIVIEDGKIRDVIMNRLPDSFQMGNLLILPGIVDIHGDAFERQLRPRPTAGFSIPIALRETDRQLISNGITTAFYGITVSWEPGLRSFQQASLFIQEMERNKATLAVDSRVHLRFETRAHEAIDPVCEWLRERRVDLLSFNDHVEMIRRKLFSPHGASEYAHRSGLSVEAFQQLFRQIEARTNDESISALAMSAMASHVPIATHDVESAEEYEHLRRAGCRICEFPKNLPTAAYARSYGDHVVLGAPNVVRGGTHARGLAAIDAIGSDFCTVLTSDYYYPSLLLAAFRLVNENILPLSEAWNLISKNAAEAAGLKDRGLIENGRRADFILVDDTDPGMPRVTGAVVDGNLVFLTSVSCALQNRP